MIFVRNGISASGFLSPDKNWLFVIIYYLIYLLKYNHYLRLEVDEVEDANMLTFECCCPLCEV